MNRFYSLILIMLLLFYCELVSTIFISNVFVILFGALSLFIAGMLTEYLNGVNK